MWYNVILLNIKSKMYEYIKYESEIKMLLLFKDDNLMNDF